MSDSGGGGLCFGQFALDPSRGVLRHGLVEEARPEPATESPRADRGEARPLAMNFVCLSALVGTLRDDPSWPGLLERFSRSRDAVFP